MIGAASGPGSASLYMKPEKASSAEEEAMAAISATDDPKNRGVAKLRCVYCCSPANILP